MDDDIHAKQGIWEQDLLGRERDAVFLISFLTRRIEEREHEGHARSYVLNLNARWGQGKTFFLTRLQQQLASQGYLVAYVNAWEDDHADDPLIAVMSAIDQTINPLLKKKSVLEKAWGNTKKSGLNIAVAMAKSSAIHLTKKAVGDVFETASEAADKDTSDVDPADEDTSDVEATVSKAAAAEVEALFNRQGDELLDKFNLGKAAIASFRNNLRNVLPQIAPEKSNLNLPLFVLVDELDRCRPTYAISLLERVKHLFEVDNVVFIIATDSDQLKHSIKAVYGSGFDASAYLLRFFDRTYVFEDPSLEDFVTNLFLLHSIDDQILSSPPEITHRDFFVKIMQAFNLQLRDAEQCFDMLRSIATVWNHKVKIELIYLLPLIVAFWKNDESLMEALTNNEAKISSLMSNKVKLDFWDNVRGPETRRVKEHYLHSVIQYLVSELNSPLHKMIEKDPTHQNGYVRWLFDHFRQEFMLLHSNVSNPQSPSYSIMRKYPEYVRSAGRLLIEDNSDQNKN